MRLTKTQEHWLSRLKEKHPVELPIPSKLALRNLMALEEEGLVSIHMDGEACLLAFIEGNFRKFMKLKEHLTVRLTDRGLSTSTQV